MKIGDLVTLKSGGHVMTVCTIQDDRAGCSWSVGGDVKTLMLDMTTLDVVDALGEPTIINPVTGEVSGYFPKEP